MQDVNLPSSDVGHPGSEQASACERRARMRAAFKGNVRIESVPGLTQSSSSAETLVASSVVRASSSVTMCPSNGK